MYDYMHINQVLLEPQTAMRHNITTLREFRQKSVCVRKREAHRMRFLRSDE